MPWLPIDENTPRERGKHILGKSAEGRVAAIGFHLPLFNDPAEAARAGIAGYWKLFGSAMHFEPVEWMPIPVGDDADYIAILEAAVLEAEWWLADYETAKRKGDAMRKRQVYVAADMIRARKRGEG